MDIEDIVNHYIERESIDQSKEIIKLNVKENNLNDIYTNIEHGLPYSVKIYIKTWGCSHNNSDGEYMAGILANEGFQLIENDVKKYDADIWILNGCTVKDPSQLSFNKEIKISKKHNIKLILAGCVPQAEPLNKEYNEYSMRYT